MHKFGLFIVFTGVLALPVSGFAQAPAMRRGQVVGLGVRLPVGRNTQAAPRCDNSGFQAIAGRKRLGTTLLWGGGIATGIAIITAGHGTSTAPLTLAVAGIGTSLVGWYVRSSADNPTALDKAVASLRVGETRSTDVATCMGKPTMATTKSSGEEIWTYTVTKTHVDGGPIALFVPVSSSSMEMRSVTLTFKNGVLSDISKTATGN